eukprot:970402-Amphidinium_carterae.1
MLQDRHLPTNNRSKPPSNICLADILVEFVCTSGQDHACKLLQGVTAALPIPNPSSVADGPAQQHACMVAGGLVAGGRFVGGLDRALFGACVAGALVVYLVAGALEIEAIGL